MRRSIPLSLVLLPVLAGFTPLVAGASPPPCEVTHTLWRGGELLGNIHMPIALEPPIPPNMGMFALTRAFDDIRELTQTSFPGGPVLQQPLVFAAMRMDDESVNSSAVTLEQVDPDEAIPAERVLRLYDEGRRIFVATMQLSVERVPTPHPQILAACRWLRAGEGAWLVHWTPAR